MVLMPNTAELFHSISGSGHRGQGSERQDLRLNMSMHKRHLDSRNATRISLKDSLAVPELRQQPSLMNF